MMLSYTLSISWRQVESRRVSRKEGQADPAMQISLLIRIKAREQNVDLSNEKTN